MSYVRHVQAFVTLIRPISSRPRYTFHLYSVDVSSEARAWHGNVEKPGNGENEIPRAPRAIDIHVPMCSGVSYIERLGNWSMSTT